MARFFENGDTFASAEEWDAFVLETLAKLTAFVSKGATYGQSQGAGEQQSMAVRYAKLMDAKAEADALLPQ